MTRPGQDQEAGKRSARGWGNLYLLIFFGLFGLFILNVLLGKAVVQFGWSLPFLLGDVPEFLLLLVSALFLMLAALARERHQSGDNQ